MRVLSRVSVVDRFPGLLNALNITSPETENYNCVAWAFGDNQRVWWPCRTWTYWPDPSAANDSLQTFISFLISQGWSSTSNRDSEADFEKLAIYIKDGRVTHMARQLESGAWTSKLGQSVDISHSLEQLEGTEYGRVSNIMCRQLPKSISASSQSGDVTA